MMGIQATSPKTTTPIKVFTGTLEVCPHAQGLFEVEQIGTSLAVLLYDRLNKIGAVAHILVPNSQLMTDAKTPVTASEDKMPAKFADTGIPLLLERFEKAGGQKISTVARIVGGAQLFNFGGGGGNPLNIGSRNAITVRTLLTRNSYTLEKADIGGNKGRSLRFTLENGQVAVQLSGGKEYYL